MECDARPIGGWSTDTNFAVYRCASRVDFVERGEHGYPDYKTRDLDVKSFQAELREVVENPVSIRLVSRPGELARVGRQSRCVAKGS